MSAQSWPILCDPMDWSLPGSSVHGILQARVLEWAAISSPGVLPDPGIEPASPALAGRFLTASATWRVWFGTVSTMAMKGKWSHSVVSFFATPWTVAYQASQSMGFSRQEYWGGVPFPLQRIFQGMNLGGLPCCRQTLYPLSHQGSPPWPWALSKLWLLPSTWWEWGRALGMRIEWNRGLLGRQPHPLLPLAACVTASQNVTPFMGGGWCL